MELNERIYLEFHKTGEVLPVYNFRLKYEVVNDMRIFHIATDIRHSNEEYKT